MNGILEYSIQLAMLRQLLSEKLINKQEYFKIKKLLMEKYKISSDRLKWSPICGFMGLGFVGIL